MAHDPLSADVLRQISPQNVRSYAVSQGWERVKRADGNLALFQWKDQLEQLIVPSDQSQLDYVRRMSDVLRVLSEVEGRSKEEIAADLLSPDADVIRYSVASPETNGGSISLKDGLRLLDGARRSLLSAACSVINPARYHVRLSRAEADQLLNTCRLNQTERGSFTIALSCPLRAVEQEQNLLPGSESFTRKATTLLMRSVSRIVEAIDSDEAHTLYEDSQGAIGRDGIFHKVPLSANLCDALLRMHPGEERASLTISASWASIRPLVGEQIPHRIRLRPEHFPVLHDVYRGLRPEVEPHISTFVGFVETLNGIPTPEGQMEGECIFWLLHEDEQLHVRVDLSASEYAVAANAHMSLKPVIFSGVLHRGRRVHRITQITGFRMADSAQPAS